MATAPPRVPRVRISQGGEGPSPPLAGALAAWVLRAGGDVVVVDPRGGVGTVDEAPGAEVWPLWAHLEGGFGEERLAEVVGRASGAELVLFGPGADEERLLDGGDVRVVRGDPELGLYSGGLRPRTAGSDVGPLGGWAVDGGLPDPPDLSDLSVLPLTTYAGFGSSGGAFRLLAGRGDRVKPVALVIREVIYLVESAHLGHVLFDDADLAHYGDWIERFEAELRHLPWTVTWEGTWRGARTGVRGTG